MYLFCVHWLLVHFCVVFWRLDRRSFLVMDFWLFVHGFGVDLSHMLWFIVDYFDWLVNLGWRCLVVNLNWSSVHLLNFFDLVVGCLYNWRFGMNVGRFFVLHFGNWLIVIYLKFQMLKFNVASLVSRLYFLWRLLNVLVDWLSHFMVNWLMMDLSHYMVNLILVDLSHFMVDWLVVHFSNFVNNVNYFIIHKQRLFNLDMPGKMWMHVFL